jgi:hypothetical protein
MGLTHFPGEALIHRRAERDLVDQSAVDPRHRQRSRRAANVDHFAKHVGTVRLKHHRLLDAVVHGIEGAGCMRLHAHGVDALFGISRW